MCGTHLCYLYLFPLLLLCSCAAAVATMQMQFTPVTALVGGLTLGIAATGKFAIAGRVLGISGALKGFVQGNVTPWRVLFTLGMVAGALIAKGITPNAFDVLPATFTVSWDRETTYRERGERGRAGRPWSRASPCYPTAGQHQPQQHATNVCPNVCKHCCWWI